jgi:molybdate transport system permease protein
VTTLILFVVGTPIAWWLARTRSRWKGPVGAVVALPLVLPPSVLGFYLLVTMGPNGPVGQLTQALGIGLLALHLLGAGGRLGVLFAAVHGAAGAERLRGHRRAAAGGGGDAARLAAGRLLHRRAAAGAAGLRHAGILTFAHTVGEFGVVLMIGGNIPGVTRVASVQIYDYVEALEYADAHRLAAILLVFSFLVLLALYSWRPDRSEADPGPGRQTDRGPLSARLARLQLDVDERLPAAASPRCSATRAPARPRCCAASPGWSTPPRARLRFNGEVWQDETPGCRPTAAPSAMSSRRRACSRT